MAKQLQTSKTKVVNVTIVDASVPTGNVPSPSLPVLKLLEETVPLLFIPRWALGTATSETKDNTLNYCYSDCVFNQA